MILLTGFEPFLGETVNPSKELLGFYFSALDIHTLSLPVSYQKSFLVLKEKLSHQSYDHIIMLGQAGGRTSVSLERVALNWMDSEFSDEEGQVFCETKILDQGREAHFSSYPLREWYRLARQENLPIQISNSAGAFVCNSLSYQVGQHIADMQMKTKWLFVHVPFLPEQGEKKNEPSMELIQMKTCLDFILSQVRA
ncbi:MAG: pyrrolidone-carboxylate peptidase [Oligoflexia bacterium]|nr:MAG: pyrrolidone-carboxylate peptidase [Oligoflexia bacterium]